METNSEVGNAIRAEMARTRVTQALLAAHLNLSQAAVSRRLNGDVGFDAKELAIVARVVGKPVSIFFEGIAA